MPTLQQITKTEINLSSNEERTNVGLSLAAINQVLTEAANAKEKIGFLEIIKRSYHRKNELEIKFNEQQKQLQNGNDTGTE